MSGGTRHEQGEAEGDEEDDERKIARRRMKEKKRRYEVALGKN